MRMKVMVREDLTAADIKDYLDTRVVGQEEAKRNIALLGFLHHVRRVHDDGDNKGNSLPWKSVTGKSLPPIHGLVAGPTGCGKTYLLHTMAEYLGFPVVKIDTSALVPDGYKGVCFKNALSTAMNDLLAKGRTPKEMGRAIVILDEFDKLCASSSAEGRNESYYAHIQYSLLKALEGDVAFIDAEDDGNPKRKVATIDTKNMLFVLGGSFNHLIKAMNDKKTSIGFNREEKTASPSSQITHKELESSGLIRELAGRISVVTQVLPLTKDELRQALNSTEGATAHEFAAIFNVCSTSIEDVVTQEIEDKVVEKCFNMGLGARGLRTALFEEIRDALESLVLSTYSERLFDDGRDIDVIDGIRLEGSQEYRG